MKNKKDLFDLFKESEHKIQPTPSRHAWDKLERKLDARKDINQTSKYRSIAQIAAVVALVSIAAVIALLSSNNNKTNLTASAIDTNSTWEEIALEKSGKNADDLVAFNKSVETKKVLMNEGTTDKKLVPKINKAKSATNKIQNYKDDKLAGDIDIATNTYEMHEAPLEREVLLGEVSINKNTTIEEIEEKALGSNNKTYADVADEVTNPYPIATRTSDMAAAELKEEISEAAQVADVVLTTAAPPAAGIPQYEITEVNAPNAETDVVVGEAENEFFTTRMDQITVADRRLEESVAEASTKVRKEKKSRDIFSRNKAKRQSDAIAPSSIGIASNASAAKDKAKEYKTSNNLFTELTGNWKSIDNATSKEWLMSDPSHFSFRSIDKTAIDYDLQMIDQVWLLTNHRTNQVYRYTHNPGDTMIFQFSENGKQLFTELDVQNDKLIIRSYHVLSKEDAFMQGGQAGEQKDLEEEVFVRL